MIFKGKVKRGRGVVSFARLFPVTVEQIPVLFQTLSSSASMKLLMVFSATCGMEEEEEEEEEEGEEEKEEDFSH